MTNKEIIELLKRIVPVYYANLSNGFDKLESLVYIEINDEIKQKAKFKLVEECLEITTFLENFEKEYEQKQKKIEHKNKVCEVMSDIINKIESHTFDLTKKV